MAKITKPDPSELSDYYKSYLHYIGEEDLLNMLEEQMRSTQKFLDAVNEKDSQIAYQAGKWQLKEVIAHLSDAERILAYRALRFARKDRTPLAGFEEDDYAKNSNAKNRNWESIIEEKMTIRKASIALFNSFDEEYFEYKGIANDSEYSVRSLLFFIIVHERHHLQVIKDRYLKD